MSERMTDEEFERRIDPAVGESWSEVEARRARASEATLRAQVEEMRRALEEAKGERDEARSAIPHPGDGSCARCGSVPTMPVPLCESCDGELTALTPKEPQP